MNTFLAFVIISLCGISQAIKLPVVSRSVEQARNNGKNWPKMHKMASNTMGDQVIDNVRDVLYATNITLGGQQLHVQLDTGSSDLWVKAPAHKPIHVVNQTTIPANETFGIGFVGGHIAFANMTLGRYSVPQQAFLNVENATQEAVVFDNGLDGLLGLAFDDASVVDIGILLDQGRTTRGRTFMSNIFAQNTSAPNFFSVRLGRSASLDKDEDSVDGIFTIGEVDEDFPTLLDQPKLPRFPNPEVGARWSTAMDGMRINGTEFKFAPSVVPGAPKGKTIVVLDTGFTSPPLPVDAVNAIYSKMHGAVFNKTTNLWQVDCMATNKLEFEFSGKKFPVHPLDLTTMTKDHNNKTICVNTFRPITFNTTQLAQFDMILGDAFLKNAYVAFDFGDATKDNKTNNVPFLRMLPTTTNHTAALHEFKAVRSKALGKTHKPAHNSTTPRRSPLAARADASSAGPRPARQVIAVHFRAPAAVQHCVTTVLEHYGPVVLALLSGLLITSFMLCIVSVALLVRVLIRPAMSMHGEYVAVDADVDILENPNAAMWLAEPSMQHNSAAYDDKML